MTEIIDHYKLDKFLGRVLDDYKTGKLEKGAAVARIAHLLAARDKDNDGEVAAILDREQDGLPSK